MVSNDLWAPLGTGPWTRKEHSIPVLCCDLLTPAAFGRQHGCKAMAEGLAKLEEARLRCLNVPENCSPDPIPIIPHRNMRITYAEHQITALTWTCARGSQPVTLHSSFHYFPFLNTWYWGAPHLIKFTSRGCGSNFKVFPLAFLHSLLAGWDVFVLKR